MAMPASTSARLTTVVTGVSGSRRSQRSTPWSASGPRITSEMTLVSSTIIGR